MKITFQLVGEKCLKKEDVRKSKRHEFGMIYENQELAFRSYPVTDEWTLLTRVFCYQDYMYEHKTHQLTHKISTLRHPG